MVTYAHEPLVAIKYTIKFFLILKRCYTEYETKIQDALLIKNINPKLNNQLYAKDATFLLNIFQVAKFSVTL